MLRHPSAFWDVGRGKSTLLNLIEANLLEEPLESRSIVVRFDAWLYQGFDDVRAALMEEIAARLLRPRRRRWTSFEGKAVPRPHQLFQSIGFVR
jgi:hypothetical protein